MTQPKPSPRVAGKALLAVVAVICIATSAPPPVPPADVPMWSIANEPLTLPCGTADVWVSKSGKTGLGITVRIMPTRSTQAGQGVTGKPAQIADDPDRAPSAVDPAQRPTTAPRRAGEPVASRGAPIDPAQGCPASIRAGLRFPDRDFPGRLVVQNRGSEIEAHERQQREEYVSPGVAVSGMPDPSLLDATYSYLAFELDNEERWNRGERSATLELSIEVGGQVRVWRMPATHAYREWPARRR